MDFGKNIYAVILCVNKHLCLLSLPTDVQAEAIPLILGGGDVLMVVTTDIFVINNSYW